MSFYVYIHKKPTGEVFYVGKGTKNRAWNRHGRNPYWNNIYKKYGTFIVEIVQDNLQEWYAFELEQELMLKHENLANISEGGCGNGGYKLKPEDRLKISEKVSGLGNGRADLNTYNFINIVTNQEFIGTRWDFQEKFDIKVGDLFNDRALTVYSWCLKENLHKIGSKLKYDPRMYLFKNKITGEEVNLTRRDFNKRFGIEAKGLFSGKLKSLHGWQVLGLTSDFT